MNVNWQEAWFLPIQYLCTISNRSQSLQLEFFICPYFMSMYGHTDEILSSCHILSWPLSINHARKAVMCSYRCQSFLAFCKSKFIPLRGDFQSWFNVARKPYACIGFLFFSMATGTTSASFFFLEDFHNPSVCKTGSPSQMWAVHKYKQYTNTWRIRAN